MAELIVGPFFGVIGAFAVQRAYDKYKNKQERSKLKRNLKSELESCLPLLNNQGNLLPKIMWDCSIASGDIGLLSFTDRTKLSTAYFRIDNYNYEAKRVRDSAVIAQTGDRKIIVDGMSQALAYWKKLSQSLMLEELRVKDMISKLLQDEMWKK